MRTSDSQPRRERLAEINSGNFRYNKVPKCAYEVGTYFIEKDGIVTVTSDENAGSVLID